MASYPPPPPPPPQNPPTWGYDPHAQRRYYRDQARAQRAVFRARMQQARYQMRGMRRGSVLGPLLLIAAGVLFLLIQTGRIDSARFWPWYGRWWPLLLVAAGVVLLAEWAFDQIHQRDPQQKPYRRSIGGGVVLLLIFAVLGAIGHHIAAGEIWDNGGWHFDSGMAEEMLGERHESDQSFDLALTSGGSLAVDAPHGGVTIAGTSDDGRVHVAVHKQFYAQSDSDADSLAQQLTPEVSYTGSTLNLSVRPPEGGIADLTITVPAATATSVNAKHGDIHIVSIKAPVWAVANHGDIELSAITGPAAARIENHNSSLSAHDLASGLTFEGRAQDVILSQITGPVSVRGDFFGTTHFERINGAVHLHTSRTDLQMSRLDGEVGSVPDEDFRVDQAVGPFFLTTSNRNISMERISGQIVVRDRNGTVKLTAAPPLGAITLEDANGTVNLVVPERTGFAVEANTTNGQIDTGFPLAASGNENYRSLNGVVGAGGPLVHISTTNGDISIHKGEVQPLPASPPTPPKLTLVPAPLQKPSPPAHASKPKNINKPKSGEPSKP